MSSEGNCHEDQGPQTRSGKIGSERRSSRQRINQSKTVYSTSSSCTGNTATHLSWSVHNPGKPPIGFSTTSPSVNLSQSQASLSVSSPYSSPNSSQGSSVSTTSPWPNLPRAMEKSPLGHFKGIRPAHFSPERVSVLTGNNPRLQLGLQNGDTAGSLFAFGARNLFLPTALPNRTLDTVEAMEIDSQEEEEACGSSCSVQTKPAAAVEIKVSPSHSAPTGPSALTPVISDSTSLGAEQGKSSTQKSNDGGELPEKAKKPKEQASKQSFEMKNAVPQKTEAAKKKPIYIVLHVAKVQVGELIGKATAPVKIYADKIFIEMESEGVSDSFSFRISCKDLSHCKVSLDKDPFILVVRPTAAYACSMTDKYKRKGKFLDPENEDPRKRDVVLHMNYKTMPSDVKADLLELFQNRFSGQLEWQETSSEEMGRYLKDEEDKPSLQPIAEKQNSDSSDSSRSLEQRRVLTPKGKCAAKRNLLAEGSKTSSGENPGSPTAKNKESPKSESEENNTETEVPRTQVQTRSRRRKAPSDNESKPSEKKSHSEVDLLHRHQEMETHISLLDQHSKEQRVNLEMLLQEERAMKDRNLFRLQELELVLREMELCNNQQAQSVVALNREVEQERISRRQLQQELEQERERSSRVRKLQTDLFQVRRALDEEKLVRSLREQQLSDRESALAELQSRLNDQQQIKERLEESVRQTRDACKRHEDALQSEQMSRENQSQQLRDKDAALRERERLHDEERTARTELEQSLRRLQLEVDDERCSRQSLERELRLERTRLREERTTLERERADYETRLREERTTLERERTDYEARLRENQRAITENERRLQELQSAVAAAQEALDEYRRLEPRDWIIRREEVRVGDRTLGIGAWGSVTEGTFRGCSVAVKRIHDLILSPHNRRLFEREMSIASRCRHPCLLQFIGATNDDNDSPLFVTEMLDTDLRAVLTLRALHQEEILSIALDIARALNYLHLSKPEPIMHRDISSSNVLLWRRDDHWRAKLSDYGAANFMRQFMTVNPGARIYAAPEALTSQQSPKVDVYSFGLLLCEMCVRELPVPQQIQDQIGLVTNSVLRELIMRCVRTEPDARPTIAEVITILERRVEDLRAQELVSVNGRSATV